MFFLNSLLTIIILKFKGMKMIQVPSPISPYPCIHIRSTTIKKKTKKNYKNVYGKTCVQNGRTLEVRITQNFFFFFKILLVFRLRLFRSVDLRSIMAIIRAITVKLYTLRLQLRLWLRTPSAIARPILVGQFIRARTVRFYARGQMFFPSLQFYKVAL